MAGRTPRRSHDLRAFDRTGGLTPDPEGARVAMGTVALVEERSAGR
jgi:hypothetical protein